MNNVMQDHLEWEELAAGAVLGGLDADEHRRFATHLATCAECQQTVAADQQVAERLDRSIPLVVAPPAIEARLLRQIRAERRRPKWRGSRFGLAAAVGLALLVFAGFWLRDAQHPAPPPANIIALLAADGTTQGQFSWTAGQPEASLVIEGLPPLADGEYYYLWLTRKDGTADHVARYALNQAAPLRASVRAPAPWREYRQILITTSLASDMYTPPSAGILEGDF